MLARAAPWGVRRRATRFASPFFSSSNTKVRYSSRLPNVLPIFVRFWAPAEFGIYSRMGPSAGVQRKCRHTKTDRSVLAVSK